MARIWMVGMGVLLVTAGVAIAATLDDFKEAVKHTGCDSIPYESLRETCNSQARERDDYCKKRGEFSCDKLDPTGLLQQIGNIKQKIVELTEQLGKLKDERSKTDDEDARSKLDSQITALQSKIDELQGRVDEMQKRLDDEKHEIESRIYIGEHCLDARVGVQAAFTEARSNASSESDEQIKPLAAQLIKAWDDGAKDHEQATTTTDTAVKKCKSFR